MTGDEPVARVAHTLSLMYAPHEHAQHLRHRVLSIACPSYLTAAEIKGDVGATRATLPIPALTRCGQSDRICPQRVSVLRDFEGSGA